VSAQPNETPAESIRNALQILKGQPLRDIGYFLSGDDIEAIRARLEDALAKLEGPTPDKVSD
jgi:hypothetical protein